MRRTNEMVENHGTDTTARDLAAKEVKRDMETFYEGPTQDSAVLSEYQLEKACNGMRFRSGDATYEHWLHVKTSHEALRAEVARLREALEQISKLEGGTIYDMAKDALLISRAALNGPQGGRG